MSTSPRCRVPARRSRAAPRRLPTLASGLLLLLATACGGVSEATSAPEETVVPSLSATTGASPAPSPPEPSSTDGEDLHGTVDVADAGTVDGEAPGDAPAPDVKALAALEALPVKGRAPKTGYDRDEFGSGWLDVDGNGCDTRNDMLRRDLENIVTSDGCTVTRGTLDPDPYTATTIDFVRGVATSSDVQIDHVVALSDAWQKGAQQLDANSRVLFANDPLNLLAVDGPTNQSKGDSDAATWLPPNAGFRCEYVATQIAVKAKYELWVTQAEKDAMARVLSDCDGQTLPGDPGAVAGSGGAPAAVPPPAVEEPPVVAPVPAPVAPAPAPVAPAPVSYANCSAVRAAGAAPIYAGQPGFGSHLDRDADGVACE
jgi:hypothetical protein